MRAQVTPTLKYAMMVKEEICSDGSTTFGDFEKISS
jgi:hypothetical protein